MKTLLITAAASAVAAYACAKLWAPGTLAAAAFTPVFVAIVKDLLAKSTDVVARAVPVRGIVRSAGAQTPAGSGPREARQPPVDPRVLPPPPVASPFGDPLLPPIIQPPDGAFATEVPDDPASRVAQSGEITYHGGGRRRGVRAAIVTGLLGFLLAAVALTVPELVAGGSTSGNGRGTTFFGGGTDRDTDAKTSTTPSETTPKTTVTVPETEPEADPTTAPVPETLPPTGGEAAPPPVPAPAEPEVQPAPDAVEPPAAQPLP